MSTESDNNHDRKTFFSSPGFKAGYNSGRRECVGFSLDSLEQIRVQNLRIQEILEGLRADSPDTDSLGQLTTASTRIDQVIDRYKDKVHRKKTNSSLENGSLENPEGTP